MSALRSAAVEARPVGQAWESFRRATECALVGVLWLIFSLPVVTAGAAWLAVCEISDAWSRDVEPPLLRTFVDSVRHRLLRGLSFQLFVGTAALLPLLELRIALAADLPGAAVEAALLAVLSAVGVAVAVLACCESAANRLGSGAALGAAAQLCRDVPWVGGATVATLFVGVGLVWLLPVLALVMGGPLGFAITALRIRAVRSRERSRRGHELS